MARLPSPVRRLLKLCDGTRTRAALCAAGILPTDQAARAVDRLLALGVVEEVTSRRRRLTPHGVAWVSGERSDQPAPESAPIAAAPIVIEQPPVAAAPVVVEPAPIAAAPVVVEPAPVVVEPAAAAPVVVEPAPIVVEPAAIAAAPVVVEQAPVVAPKNDVPTDARNPAVTDAVASVVLAAQAALPELRFSDDEESFFASNLDHLAEYE
jgi:hypothetical protein